MAFSLEAWLTGLRIGEWHLLMYGLKRKHGNELRKLEIFFFLKCSAHDTKHHKSSALEHRGGGYSLNTCRLYHFKLGSSLLAHWIAPGFANAHLRTSPTACGACAETFIRNAELGRCSGKWNLGPFALWFLPAATMSQLARLSLSPHLLPLFCHQLENVQPTIILDAGSACDTFSSFMRIQSSSWLQVGYC